jgi:hypothetical protein
MPSSPTTLSTARATASVVSSFALTAAATDRDLHCSAAGFSLMIPDHLTVTVSKVSKGLTTVTVIVALCLSVCLCITKCGRIV